MAIEKLTLVNVEGPLKKVNKTLVHCCESGYFHMSPPPDVSGTYLEAKSLRDKGQYERMIKRCRVIAQQLGVTLDENVPYDSVEYNVSIDFKRYLDGVEKKLSELYEEKRALEKTIKEHGAIYNNLEQFDDLDIDFAELFACEFIKIRFGYMPASNIRKLDYYKDRPYFFYRFRNDKDSVWCIYIVAKNQRDEADYLFNSLGFHRVMLPAYLSGNGDEATELLVATIRTETEKLEAIDADIAELAKQ